MNLKRFAGVALLLPALAQAELSRLDVQITPDSAHYEKDDGVTVTATGNGTGMEYRFVLARNGAVLVPVVSTNWSAANSFEFDFAPYNVLPGVYRVNVLAREAANRKVSVSKLEYFRVGSLPPANAAIAEKQALVRARYEYAKQVLRESMLSGYRMLGSGRDTDSQCSYLASANNVIDYLINPAGQRAPGGIGVESSLAFVGAVGGDAFAGAIGVVAGAGCSNPFNFDDIAFTVYLPAYPAGGSYALEPESTLIRFADVLSAEENPARREEAMALVRSRYEKAQVTLRRHFDTVRTMQSLALDVTSECTNSSSAADLINAVLDLLESIAPKGGPGFSSGLGSSFTGAIGVNATVPCTDPTDWRAIEFTLHLPAFLDIPAASVTVGYDD